MMKILQWLIEADKDQLGHQEQQQLVKKIIEEYAFDEEEIKIAIHWVKAFCCEVDDLLNVLKISPDGFVRDGSDCLSLANNEEMIGYESDSESLDSGDNSDISLDFDDAPGGHKVYIMQALLGHVPIISDGGKPKNEEDDFPGLPYVWTNETSH